MINLNNFTNGLKVGVLLSAILVSTFLPAKAEDPEINALQMSCISWLQVSLGANGEAILTPQMLLSSPHPDYSIFVVNIVDPPIGGSVVDCSLLDETISVMVTNTITNNSCWSMVFIEDKLNPIIECSDREMDCWQPFDFADPEFFLDTLYDNCTAAEDMDLWFSQSVQLLNCHPQYEATIIRTWTATDNSGNSASCQQNINILRGDIDEVIFPEDIVFDCPFTDITPDITGFPTLNGEEVVPACGIFIGYTDTSPVPLCNGGQSYKVFRTWTAMDWCAMEIRTSTQKIEVIDTIPSQLICPQNITIFTGINTCNATYIFPNVQVEDACSDVSEIDIRFRVNGVLTFDPLTVIPVGPNTIEVQAIDPCFNTSICEYTVTVEDNVPPVPVCHNLVVTLPQMPVITLTVEAIVSSFTITDNCEVDENSFLIRRMEDLCNKPDDLNFGTTIDLCCADVPTLVTVELQVSDIYGNSNYCMFTIDVQDKTPPVITFCPPDVTINCDDEMDDLSVYGEAKAEDLCDNEIIREEVESNINNCGEGVIIRTFIADNGSGFTDTCYQNIQVVNPYTFTIDTIIWPMDVNTTICNPDLSPSGLGGEPVVEVGPTCSMVFGIGFTDMLITQSENCLEIHRTWSVTDSCSNTDITHTQVLVFNMSEGPSLLTNPANSATISCIDQATEPTELPVVVDACGDTLSAVGPVVTNDPNPITCEGVRTYTWTYTDCSGNELLWTFTYTVIYDLMSPVNQGQTVSCPDDTDLIPTPPVVLDACGVQISPTGPVVSPKPSCEGQRTYTWTYTDCANNTVTFVYTYTVVYADFGLPSNGQSIVNCPDDTDLVPTPPVVVDACGAQLSPIGPVVSAKPICEGQRTYIWTYTDCAGNTQDWTFTYNVTYETFEINVPNGLDTIECPLQIVIPQPPVVFDNCGNELDAVLVQTPEIPECEGEAQFVFEYEDCAGNVQSWSYTYVVIYQPFETIPDFSFEIMCPGQIGMPFPPEVFDNCFIELEPIGDPEISEIPECEGMVTFTWTFEDCAGNQDQFTGIFIITLTDPPSEVGGPVDTSATVSCISEAAEPQNLPVVEDACGNIIPAPVPVVTDDPNPLTCDGSRVYTYSYFDCAGNVFEWTFTYTIEYQDFSVPSNDTLFITCNDTIIHPQPIQVFDNCGNELAGELIIQDTIPACEGEVVYTFQYEDCAGNTQLWSFVYIIQVTDSPVLPANVVDTIPCPDPDFEPVPPSGIVDQCGNPVEPTGPEVEAVTDTINNLQIITYTYEYEDCAGNISFWTYTLAIDIEDLDIECPENIEVSNDPGLCEADITIDAAIVTGGCGIDSLFNNYNFTADASDIYPVGETVVTFTVIDITGASATCMFTVTVNDDEAPVIECPADITASTDDGECFATEVDLGEVEFDDNCPGVVVSVTIPDTFEVGVTIITYTAIDVSGNSAECDQTITVEDNENPSIMCPEELVVSNDAGECFATDVEFDAAVVSDNCGIDTVIVMAPDTFFLGVTTIFYVVTDIYGNTAECEASVRVIDEEPPVLDCPDEIIVEAEPMECEAEVVLMITATDNCTESLQITNSYNNGGADASGAYPLGETIVIFFTEDESGNMASCSVTVIVEGGDPLDIECPEDIEVSNDPGLCEADITIDAAIVTGGCGIDSLFNNYNFTADASDIYPVGVTVVTFTVMDETGATASCSFTVVVEDNEDPVVNCPDDIVQANDRMECGAEIEITVVSFSDNCGIDTIFNSFTETLEANGFYPVDTTVVTYTVIDVNGNSAQCSFTVIIFDDEDPEIDCPSNIEIPCSDYDPNLDLSQFGLPDTSDNCGIIFFSEEVSDEIDECSSTGFISRTFEIFDAAGNNASCTQIIEFIGKSVLDSLDFIWPEEFILITDCSVFNPDSIPGGEPVLNPDVETCNEISIVMEDETIMSDTACDVIIRTWTVTDLCNPSTGEWVFIQTITVEDTIGPEFIAAPVDTIMAFADSISCDAFVQIIVEAEDDCAGVVIITNNSPFAINDGADASGVYPVGLTTFDFEAVDNCGNISILEINVLVIDTVPPVIGCFKFRYNIDDNLSVVAVDSDFVNFLADNCSDSVNINITFDLSDPNKDTLFINFTTCDSVPGLFPIVIYAIDEFGNVDSCETQIGFDDPNMFCPDSLVGNINGLVYHHDLNRMLSEVEVYVESPFFGDQIITDGFGLYEFLHVPQLAEMQLRPFKDDDPLNGVTTFDIYLLQRHILGMNMITNPYYLIAADINNDGQINVLDVVELRRLILGTNDRFLNNNSWRFFDKTFIMPQGINPTQFDLPESVEVVFSQDRFFQQDFVGVKIGDLNGNVITSLENSESESRRGAIGLYAQDRLVKSGDLVKVDFYFGEKKSFNGIQFDLNWESYALEVESIHWCDNFETNEDNYQLSLDDLTASLRYSNSSPSIFETDEMGYLFSITFKTNHSGMLSDWIEISEEKITPELFRGVTELNSLELRFSNTDGQPNENGTAFELFQNRPNPFSNHTIIPFITDEDGRVELFIYDIAGKQVASMYGDFSRGYNQWEINTSSLGLSGGVYYYQLKVGNHQAVRKMIVK